MGNSFYQQNLTVKSVHVLNVHVQDVVIFTIL